MSSERPDEIGHRPAPYAVLGLFATLLIHAGIFGALWFSRMMGQAPTPPPLGNFVDAQLVRFGKPRDLSFLPHKQGVVKDIAPPEALKIAIDANQAPSKPDDKKKPDEIDPLKKTRAQMFKHLLDDDRPAAVMEEGGSLQGSRAGTSDEARGDPYILNLIDTIGSSWTIPTTIRDSELANLSAEVCLTVNSSGVLSKYEFKRRSGNSQFDSSLEARLGTIKTLPPPPERYAKQAARGWLCPTFFKQ